MTAITEWLLALLDLIELEGRMLRRSILRLGWGLVLVAICALSLTAGVGLMGWGLYQILDALMGPAAAALILGMLLVAFAGIIAWFARLAVR